MSDFKQIWYNYKIQLYNIQICKSLIDFDQRDNLRIFKSVKWEEGSILIKYVVFKPPRSIQKKIPLYVYVFLNYYVLKKYTNCQPFAVYISNTANIFIRIKENVFLTGYSVLPCDICIVRANLKPNNILKQFQVFAKIMRWTFVLFASASCA